MGVPFQETLRAVIARSLDSVRSLSMPAEGEVLPLSPAQRRIWLGCSPAPHTGYPCGLVMVHHRGALDAHVLEMALQALGQRHMLLRTSFGFDGVEPVQIIPTFSGLRLAIDDVGHLPPEERDLMAMAMAAAAAAAPVDAVAIPPMRAHLIRLAVDDHRLVLMMHPVLFDAVAVQTIMLPDLARIYQAFAADTPLPLRAPPDDYGDYIAWKRPALAADARRRQLGHWREAFADAPPRFDPVTDWPRPAVPDVAGVVERFAIPQPLVDALDDFAAARDTSLPIVMLAAWMALLHRQSGEQDIVIGGVADRVRQAADGARFRNLIALRSRADPDLPFDAHLARIDAMAEAALEAADVPFDDVVRVFGTPHAAEGAPPFAILFSLGLPRDTAPAGWDIQRMDRIVGCAGFDLHVALEARPDGMAARFHYSADLFDRTTIRAMHDQWLAMLAGIVAAPATPIGILPLMSDEEAYRVARWNATARAWHEQTLIDIIEAQARRTPDAPAISCAGQEWDYRMLDRRIGAIAAQLVAAGIGHGSLVAVALDRSPDLVAGLLGIVRVGAAWLPLDAGQPAARIAGIIDDSAPDLVLTQASLIEALAIGDLPVILVDRCPPALAPPASFRPRAADLAYVIYTSGSTGKPKGVEITHRALANFIRAMQERPGFPAGGSLLAVTAVTFDIAVLELLLPLASGGRVVIAPAETSRDPKRLRALIAAERPGMMQATPATWLSLLEAGWGGDTGLTCLCGGEAMPRALADRLLDRCAALWNMYGPTEATVWATAARIGRGEAYVAIGLPIANMSAQILDPADRPVPRGIVGALYLGGPGLARGYRGKPALTRDRFRMIGGQRLYDTGDLARRRADGALVWLGRADHEEKIRGYRVAVEEVEGALTALPEVAAAAVRGWPDASGMRTLVAYVVRAGSARLRAASLRRRLAAFLPAYMVPGRFLFLDALPMTPSGKIDRSALAPPGPADTGGDHVPPAGKQEERLAVLWREVLGLDTFDRSDSFFDLGGNSLLAAHLLRRIESEYRRSIDLAELFRAQHFDAMVAALAEPPREPEPILPIQPHGSRPALFWLDGGPVHIELARLLGADQPFLGIPIRAMADAAPDRSFVKLAREVVRRIRTVQPQGPYLIGGWCTAGILAFEVARQLRLSGQSVPLLVAGDMIDPTQRGSAFRRLHYHIGRLIAGPDEGRMRYLLGQIRKALAWGTGIAAAPPDPTNEDAILDEAARHYRPRAYVGDVLLFRSSDWDARLGQGGWARHIGGTIIDRVFPGDHDTFFHPGKVDAFADFLRSILVR